MIINNIKLPDKVDVLGTEYKIFYETKEDNPKMEGNKGYCETCAKEIHLDTSWFGVPRKDDEYPNMILKDLWKEGIKVLRHELIHAFIIESGLDECCEWANNEEMIDWIARQFPKMVKCFAKSGIDI